MASGPQGMTGSCLADMCFGERERVYGSRGLRIPRSGHFLAKRRGGIFLKASSESKARVYNNNFIQFPANRWMAKRKRVMVSEEGSTTDSDNEQLLDSGDVGGYGDDDASSESSTAASSPENARDWKVPEGRKVVITKNPRGNAAAGVPKTGLEGRREGKEVVVEGNTNGGPPKYFRAEGLVIPTKSCLGESGKWLDPSQKFVNTPPTTRREDYFRTHGLKCYYKPGDGIPLEHFRAGLRLPMHRFFHTLMVDMRLGLGQLGPNSIRKICAFIARCTELGLEPTLTLFWSLHSLQASRDYQPLFELHWKGAKSLGGILVEVPSSNKGWHVEWLLFRGGDLGYLPEYRRPDGVNGAVRRSERLEPNERAATSLFVEGQVKGLWTEGDFWKVPFLVNHNLLLKDLPSSSRMDKSRILALARKKQVVRGHESKHSGDDSTAIGESSAKPAISTGGTHTAAPTGATDSENTPLQTLRHKKRGIKTGETGKSKKLRAGKGPGFRLGDETDGDDSDVEVLPGFMIASRGMRTDSADVGGSGSGLPPVPMTPPVEGVEGYTLIRFQARQGWLGEDPQVELPLEALSAFSLAQDRAKIERENEEDLIRKVKEAYRKLGAYLMGATERTASNRRMTTAEHMRAISEKQARDEALNLLKDSRAREEAAVL
ncbi:hypothetical protein POM88_020557 [Heracleum sosnowskyi]|uniref:Transposase (putative) gypsy type domain-containing protein n=1 Tax=Heracleum sosnowskyi TaxID=360622 RepID=A0AAD8IBM6_9APIA|nr:hypothetical protein POM88_020557 [Heracleum sosnowskyi]